MAADTERLNVVLPRDLAEKLRALVPARRRSSLVAQALAEKLVRLEQTKAVREAAGAWSDQEHPDLMTYDDYEVWIQTLRGGEDDRRRRLGLSVAGDDVPAGQ